MAQQKNLLFLSMDQIEAVRPFASSHGGGLSPPPASDGFGIAAHDIK